MSLLALMLACAVSCAEDQQAPERDVPAPPVSVERIHEQLQRPPALRMPPEPTFRVTVEEEVRRNALDMLRQELGADVLRSLPPPLIRKTDLLVAVDLLQIASMVKSKLDAARRARGERNARREVAQALADFCAQHDCSVLEQELKQSNPEGVLTH